jgi:hypothetical protein
METTTGGTDATHSVIGNLQEGKNVIQTTWFLRYSFADTVADSDHIVRQFTVDKHL